MMEGVGTILNANRIYRVAKARHEQAVELQRANNKLEAAKGTLAEWGRSLSNRRRVQASEREYNRGVEQITHEARQGGKQLTNLTVQYAEQLGALQARAAFTGVGGSSVEMMENLVSLQMSTSEEEIKQNLQRMSHYGKTNAAQIIADANNSADMTQQFGNFDFSVNIAPVRMKNRWGKLIGVAVATYFGGPEAGKAASDFAVGEWQAANGDFGGAAKNWGSAAQSGIKAWQQTSERGSSWGGDVLRGWRATGAGGEVSDKSSFVKVSGNTKKEVSTGKSWFK